MTPFGPSKINKSEAYDPTTTAHSWLFNGITGMIFAKKVAGPSALSVTESKET